METIGTKQTITFQANKQLNNNSSKPLRGFNTHPENINKNGRPGRQWTWRSLLEEAAEELMETKDGSGNTTGRKALKQLVARKLLTEAATGNVQAANAIMDRMDGKALQPIDHTTQGEKIIGPIVYQPAEDK